MIAGYLANMKEELAFYPPAIQRGLQYLLTADVTGVALGRHEIESGRIWALVSEYDTQPKAQRRPERHKKCIDIQFIVSGSEMIGCGPAAAVGAVDEDALQERDVIFYKSIENEMELILTAGMFAVYFPWDAHRPNCYSDDNAQAVRKIVVKVAMESFG